MTEPAAAQPSAPDSQTGQDVTALRQDLFGLEAEHRATRAQLEQSRRQFMQAEQIIARIPGLEDELAVVRAEHDAAQTSLAESERERARLHATLHAATTSRGWRLLAPARSLAGAARALRGRLEERI